MFRLAHRAAKDIVSEVSKRVNNRDEGLPHVLPRYLPEQYSLRQIREELIPGEDSADKASDLERLVILYSCITATDRLHQEDDQEHDRETLSLWVSKVILPNGNFVSQDEAPDDTTEASRERALTLSRQKIDVGLQCLEILLTHMNPSAPFPFLSNEILLSLLASTSSRDPWATEASTARATFLLSHASVQKRALDTDFLINYILQSLIRPLFSKSKPTTITTAGRPAIQSSVPKPRTTTELLICEAKPWKYEKPYSIPVLEWAVANIPVAILNPNFHLFIPPLLTMLDDPNTGIRARGCSILTTFLPKLPPSHLKQSGLAEVFEDALMPTLLFLPNLTPVGESVVLLPAVYEALYALCDVRYPKDDKDEKVGRDKFLDGLLRNGVLKGYLHSSEHPEIVKVLLEELRVIVVKMEIHAVKHLKDILPMIFTVLSDPFAVTNVSLLLSAIYVLQSTILNCWVRLGLSKYRLEIFKALCLCWKNAGEELVGSANGEMEKLGNVVEELKATGRIFIAAIAEGGDEASSDHGANVKNEVRMLVEVDGSLRDLFGIGGGKENEK
ncbi:hypothetical protein BGZ60DRAFT_401540 [Tricladium varicosporioides]|nr:hypothetical protein BGZ60DRAFT_401540 [Hymenoscyphus varicosporioides]